MNSKGQVLVVFIIILSILSLMLTFVIDYGLMSVEKRKISNNTYDALQYYLENIDDKQVYDKTIKLLESNLDDVQINIVDNNDYIEIEVNSNYKSLIGRITNNDLIIKYKGIKDSKEIIKG